MKLFVCIMPWFIKRLILIHFYKFKIDPSARIGFAWVFPKYLEMGSNTRIDHFTVAINLERIVLKQGANIGRSNWITGFPINTDSLHFKHQPERISQLLMGEQSSITKNHHLDCTNIISIGAFTTIAGYSSQLLTHSIDLHKNRQDSKPIYIGDYSFVGTNVVILGGGELPSFSILGAKSLLNKPFTNNNILYAGVPAVPVKKIDFSETKYFQRTTGFVD